MTETNLNYNLVKELGDGGVLMAESGSVYFVGVQRVFDECLVGLSVKAELDGTRVVCVVGSVLDQSMVERRARDLGIDIACPREDGQLPDSGLCCVTCYMLYAYLRGRVLSDPCHLVAFTVGDVSWASMDIRMFAADLRAVSVIGIDTVPVVFEGQRSSCAGHVAQSTDSVLTFARESVSALQDVVPQAQVTEFERAVVNAETLGDLRDATPGLRDWVGNEFVAYRFCHHGAMVVDLGSYDDAGCSYGLWKWCDDPRASGMAMCKVCMGVRQDTHFTDECESAVSTCESVLGATHWVSAFDQRDRSFLLDLWGPAITVRDFARELSDRKRWAQASQFQYVRCSHGVVLCDTDVDGAIGVGTLWSLSENQAESTVRVCSACAMLPSRDRVTQLEVRESIIDTYQSLSLEAVSIRRDDYGHCYTRCFPDSSLADVGAMGDSPSVARVVESLCRFRPGDKLPNSVIVSEHNGVIHVERGGSDISTVGDVVRSLSQHPLGCVVAGRCSLLGSCPSRRNVCRHCKFESTSTVASPHVSETIRQSMSLAKKSNTVMVLSRQPISNLGSTCAKKVSGDTYQTVTLDKVSGVGSVFCVEGEFVQVWFPVGSVVQLAGCVFRLEEQPMLVSGYGSLSGIVSGALASVLVVRSRSVSERVKWMHKVLGIDPGDSTFCRFWTRAGSGAVAVLSGFTGDGTAVFPSRVVCDVRDNGLEVASMRRSELVACGFEGTMLNAGSFGLDVETVQLLPGASLVFGTDYHSLNVKTDGAWEYRAGNDSYALDDGGPSDSEFDEEF